MAAVSNEDISVAFVHDQLLDHHQSGHVEADSPHFLSIAPGIFKSAKFGTVRKLCQAGVGECAMRVSEWVSNLIPSSQRSLKYVV